MIGQIEKFGTELKSKSLRNRELFKKGKIQAMKTGAPELTRPSAKRAVVALADRGCHGRGSECRRVEPLIHIVRAGVGTLSRDLQGVATKSGSSGGGARNGSRLPVLQRENPVGGPSSKHSVH